MMNEEREKTISKQPIPTKEECLAFYKELTKLADVRFVPYYKMAIEALEQEPCDDAVSRQAVEKITWEEPSYIDPINALTEVREKIRALPSVTPQQKIGHWIAEINDYGEVMGWHCDKCYEDSGFTTTCKWDYCPNCGAKMEVRNRYDRQ